MTTFSKLLPLHKIALIGGSVLTAGALIFCAFSIVGRNKAEKEMAAWKASADSAVVFAQAQKDSAEVYRSRSDSLKVVWTREHNKGIKQQIEINNLLAIVAEDSTPPTVPDSCLPWAKKAADLQNVVSAQAVRIGSLTQEANAAEDDADAAKSEASHLRTAVDTLTKKILDFPKPVSPRRSPITIGPGVGLAFVDKQVKVIPVLSVHVPINFGKVGKWMLKAVF